MLKYIASVPLILTLIASLYGGFTYTNKLTTQIDSSTKEIMLLRQDIENIHNIYSDNDANCFCLSEAFDGSASRYDTVFGIILGSGCGGGFVINKKIINILLVNKIKYINCNTSKLLSRFTGINVMNPAGIIV